MRIIIVLMAIMLVFSVGCSPKVEVVPEAAPLPIQAPTPTPLPSTKPLALPPQPEKEAESPSVNEPLVVDQAEEIEVEEEKELEQTAGPEPVVDVGDIVPHNVEVLKVSTGERETSIKIRLDKTINGLDDVIGVETDNGGDVIVITGYDKESNSIIIIGLRANSTRTLTVAYWINK